MIFIKSNYKFYVLILFFLISTLGSGCTLLNVNLVPPISPLKEKVIFGKGNDKVLLIDIDGVIGNKKKESSLGSTTEVGLVERVREVLKKAKEDNEIKGIILRINSPGGTVTSSDVIYHELKVFKEEKNIKSYTMIMDLAASGGYYIAQASDKIFAHPTSLTGSIGVIALKVNLDELMDKIGVDLEVVKSGDKKDFLSPFRPLTKEERVLFQDTIDSFHKRFVQIIANNRKMLSFAEIEKLADGRVYTAEQALNEKLIDQIVYLDEAIELVQKDLKLNEIKVVTYHRPGDYKNNLYSAVPKSPSINVLNFNINLLPHSTEPNFLYMWMP